MQPHPEGGHYKRTFEDAPGPDGRPRCTVIHFLLAAGERSHWHRVDAAEIWAWHAGAPLALSIAADAGAMPATLKLGPAILHGETPHGVVPAGAWQTAETQGEWTLVSCVVAPGFQFAGFELAPPGWRPGP